MNPVGVALSQRLSIECCSVFGNSHVEAYTERYRLTVEPLYDINIPGQVSVLAGTEVKVTFDYSTTPALETTAKLDINTFPNTVSTPFVTVASGASKSASLSLVVPAGTSPGKYEVHVLVKNGKGVDSIANAFDQEAVDVRLEITVVDPTVTVTAANVLYSGTPYEGATATVNPVSDPGEVTFTYYAASDIELASPLAGAPTNAGDYLVVATVAAAEGYNAASSSPTAFSILKVDADVTVVGFTGSYDGQSHGLTGSATGVQAEDLSGLLNLGQSYTNAGSYSVAWSFAGDQNYNAASGTEFVTINQATLSVSVLTQASLNISKAGTIEFTMSLTDATQIVDGKSIVELFTGASVSITVNGTSYDGETTATVIDNKVVFGIRMSASLQAALISLMNSGAYNGSKTPSNVFSISGSTNGGNYAFDADVWTKLFLQGKLTY